MKAATPLRGALGLAVTLGVGAAGCGPGEPPPMTLLDTVRPPLVVHTNDGNIDVYTLEVVMALAASGRIELAGIVADAGTGYRTVPYGNPSIWGEGREQYAELVTKARHSGMTRLPDPVAGASRALEPPASGRIEQTRPLNTPGSRLIRDLARQATVDRPLFIVAGGALTVVADAWLLDPSIAPRVRVLALLGRADDMVDYNGQVDGWAAGIVLQKLPYVQFPVNLAPPRVAKERLASGELPDTELTRFMIDKWQDNGLPGDSDLDGSPAIALIEPGYILKAQPIELSGWVAVESWGNGHGFVPRFGRGAAAATAWVVTAADEEAGTAAWWRAVADPAAWSGARLQRAPYGEGPAAVPGIIEAEAFDWGGEGHAYHDTEYDGWVDLRTTDRVDLDRGPGGEIYVTGIEAGEWLAYTVEVGVAAPYRLVARVAAEVPGGLLRVRAEGGAAGSWVAVPATGGATTWQEVELGDLSLQSGPGDLRVEFQAGGFTLDRLEVKGSDG